MMAWLNVQLAQGEGGKPRNVPSVPPKAMKDKCRAFNVLRA